MSSLGTHGSVRTCATHAPSYWHGDSAVRNCINAPDRINVTYNHERGKLSYLRKIFVANDNTAFEEACAMRYQGTVMPWLISLTTPPVLGTCGLTTCRGQFATYCSQFL
jgi:hypothetical protein